MRFPVRFTPDETKIPFLKWRRITVGISVLGIIASIFLAFTAGLNFGIDFRGGTLIEIKTPEAADVAALRDTLSGLNLGDVEIQQFGAPDDVLIRIAQQEGGSAAQQAAIDRVKEALDPGVEYRRVEVVGPKVSGELIQGGVIAVLLALVAILIYIWFRFEWQFSVGAILALVHDVILTIGVFSLLQIEFNLSTIAALLTIVGYSINDTVVIYDRIRENLRKFKRMELEQLIDLSVNETLSRTILTSATTLAALLPLYFFGGSVINGFTFAMIWGILVGTYSTVFMAAALVLALGVKRDWSDLPATKADKRKAKDVTAAP